jgi:hypothetical protein
MYIGFDGLQSNKPPEYGKVWRQTVPSIVFIAGVRDEAKLSVHDLRPDTELPLTILDAMNIDSDNPGPRNHDMDLVIYDSSDEEEEENRGDIIDRDENGEIGIWDDDSDEFDDSGGFDDGFDPERDEREAAFPVRQREGEEKKEHLEILLSKLDRASTSQEGAGSIYGPSSRMGWLVDASLFSHWPLKKWTLT